MQDCHGRTIAYLRLSVTASCSMRCRYCRPAQWSKDEHGCDAAHELSVDEIGHLVRHLVQQHGLRKVRLTGGEPTDRKDILEIIQTLASIDSKLSLTMTTNALRLPRMAEDLANAGLERLNISLDSLDPDTFEWMTGVRGLKQVRRGIEVAGAAGLGPVKLNTVVMRGVNDHELGSLVSFAADMGMEIRFIELMPMGPLAAKWAGHYVSTEQMRDQLSTTVADWQPLAMGTSAARRFRVQLQDGREVVLGFISAMSCPFCSQCDRIRVAAGGQVYACLMDESHENVLEALRPGFDPQAMDALLERAMTAKPEEHPLTGHVVMTQIGG